LKAAPLDLLPEQAVEWLLTCRNLAALEWIFVGRWLFLDVAPEQLEDLSGLASFSDHSDGYAVFEIWGPKVRETLAKGVPIDLHPAVFTDTVAVTVIAHIGAIVWQTAPDRFSIAVFRSYAGSFWHWLSASAAEYGLTVKAPA